MDRVTPAVHPKRPQPDAVGGELTVENVRLLAHLHRQEQRLDPGERIGDGFGNRRGLHRLESPGFAGERVPGTEVTHHQCRRDGVMAFPPRRGPDRNHLADDSFCRIRAARYDGRDVIDLDPTGHRHFLPVRELLLRRKALCAQYPP